MKGWIFAIFCMIMLGHWIGGLGADESKDNKQVSKQVVDPQFKCLSSWDGSHREFKQYIKKNLKDPKSFDHRETRITPVKSDGTQTVIMTYAGKNSFGGVVVEKAMATIRNSTCSLITVL